MFQDLQAEELRESLATLPATLDQCQRSGLSVNDLMFASVSIVTDPDAGMLAPSVGIPDAGWLRTDQHVGIPDVAMTVLEIWKWGQFHRNRHRLHGTLRSNTMYDDYD